MGPEWARRLRDFAATNGIAFHFKQWGHWAPKTTNRTAKTMTLDDGVVVYALGKKLAGRRLDGRTWNQLPTRLND